MNPEAERKSGLADASLAPAGSLPLTSPAQNVAVAHVGVASPLKDVPLAMNPSGSFEIDLSADDMLGPSSAQPVSSGPALFGPASSPVPSAPGSAPSTRSAAPSAVDLGAPTFELDFEARMAPPTTQAPPAGAPLPSAPADPFIVDLATDHRPAAAAASAPPPRRAPVRIEFRIDDSIDDVLLAARGEGASDLHLVAGRPALFRLAGRLVPRGEPIAPELLERILMPRIPPRLLPHFERDGSCDFALQAPNIGRARVNVTRQRTGLKGSFRIIPNDIPTLAGLGLPEAIGNATHHHQGLIVITGPTGHGKTTTMAAIVDIINSNTTHHVITVEDPIEFIHPRKKAMMSQREVGTNTKSFAAALKGSLREDPDVIVVGELRDTETVRMALSASETGHLVLGTMNTPSAAKTIDRLIDLFPPGDQAQVRVTLAGGLRLIVSQRLLPRKDGPGMVAAAEILPGSVPLWNLIRDNKTYQIPSLQQRGKGFGIIRLDDSLAELVNTFKVSAEDAILVADNAEELEATLSGKRVAATPPIVADAVKPPQLAASAPDPAASAAAAAKGLLGRAGALFGKKGGS
ncbi:MAG: PilT/PilU family type 4a pilus ATPase [Polyangiaceae bacterium]|nr:PilT/PilU family type 4a pilus ATPase [Polyangiaceae bacterium]